MRYQTSAAALLAAAALAAAPKAALAQQVYVGSGNGWQDMAAHPEQWEYVRRNADGFYVNFIELLHADAPACAKMAAALTHKNVYYESDARNEGLGGFPDGGRFSRALQAKEMGYLLDAGFRMPYTSLNYGLDDPKLADLKTLGLPAGKTRPVYTQMGPWTVDGDILNKDGRAPGIRANIDRTDGVSTDGPLSLWEADQGKMRAGSFSVVRYAHENKKAAVVMVAPYNLQPLDKWLETAKACVRAHEDAGAKPDIWVVFEYATKLPALPETNPDGSPANTTTGMAYWLLHHLKDPKHWASLKPDGAAGISAGRYETGVTLRNTGAWADLCPVLTATVDDPAGRWDVRIRVDGRDVTREMTSPAGLPFTGALRLWPGDSRRVQVVMRDRRGAAAAAKGERVPTVRLALKPSFAPGAPENQVVVLSPAAVSSTQLAARR